MSQSPHSEAVQSDDVLADEATQIRTSARRQAQLQNYVETLIPSHLDIPVEVVVTPHVDRAFVAPADPNDLISADGSSLSRKQARELIEHTETGYMVVVTAQESDTDALSVSHQPTADKEFQFALALHETLHILKTAVRGQHDILESEVDPQHRDYVDRLINATEDGAIENELRTGDDWSDHAATRITLARKVTSSTPPTDPEQSFTFTFADALYSGVYEYLIYESGTLQALLDPRETAAVFESADARRLFISILPALRDLRDDIFALRSDSADTLYRDDKQQSIRRAKRTIEFWSEIKDLIDEASDSASNADRQEGPNSGPPQNGSQPPENQQPTGDSQSGPTGEDSPDDDGPADPQSGSDSSQQSDGEDTQSSPDIDPDDLTLEPQETEPPSQSPTEKPEILDEPAPEDVPLNETDTTDGDSDEEAADGPESGSDDSGQESPSSEDTAQSSGGASLNDQGIGESEVDGQQGEAETGGVPANEELEQGQSSDTTTSKPQGATGSADTDVASTPADDSEMTTETDAENPTQLASIAEEAQSGSPKQEGSQPTLSDFGSLDSNSDQQEDPPSDTPGTSADDNGGSSDSEQDQDQQQEDHHQDDDYHDDYQQDEANQKDQPGAVEDQQADAQSGETESTGGPGSSVQDTQSEVPTEADTLSVDDLATDPTRLDHEIERETADSEALDEELDSLNDSLGNSDSSGGDTQLVESVEDLPILPDNTSSRHRSVAASWDTLRRSAQTVTATLEKELQLDQRTETRHGLSSGNFNSKTGYKLSYGDPRTFSRTHEGDEKRYFLMLVLDRSGSMSSFTGVDKIETAVQAVAQVAVAAEELGIDVAVVDFCDGEARLAKPASVDVDHAKDALLGLETGGGTPLADALALSQNIIDASRSQNQQALTITITDDRPDDVEAVKSQLKTFRSPVCSLTIATDQQEGNLHESAAELERAYEVTDTVFNKTTLNSRLDKFASLLGRF